jgi:predicted nucleic-acid-binding Zn-ribbon protein
MTQKECKDLIFIDGCPFCTSRDFNEHHFEIYLDQKGGKVDDVSYPVFIKLICRKTGSSHKYNPDMVLVYFLERLYTLEYNEAT